MNRETKPTKARETTHRFGIAEPSIGILLKVSFCKILLFTCLTNKLASVIIIMLSGRANTRPSLIPKLTALVKHTFYTGTAAIDRWISKRHPVKIHHGKIVSQDDYATSNSLFYPRLMQSRLAFTPTHYNNQSINSSLPEGYEYLVPDKNSASL